MSIATALPIHSELMPGERWPNLKPTVHCPGDRSKDASRIEGTNQVLQQAFQQARYAGTLEALFSSPKVVPSDLPNVGSRLPHLIL
jgi:hypothetical protein